MSYWDPIRDRVFLLDLGAQLLQPRLLSDLEVFPDLFALAALLVLEYVIGMKRTLRKLTEYLLFDLLYLLLALVLLRPEDLLDYFGILLLLSHHRVVDDFLLLGELLFQYLGPRPVCRIARLGRIDFLFPAFIRPFLIFILLMIVMS